MTVLDHLRHVIALTRKPSWVRGIPKNWGAATAGSPKADEWRLLFTIYLPIAFISLWGDRLAGPEDDRRLRVLKHTMLLVSAICIACSQTITEDLASEYLDLHTQYMQGLAELYPHISPVPNMHLAFHIPDYMKLFGPVRSWWCFPVERLVGHFQNLASNHISGSIQFFSLKVH